MKFSAENVKNANIAMCRLLLAQTFEDIEDQGPFLDVEGDKYRKVASTTGRAMTVYGPVEFARSLYRFV